MQAADPDAPATVLVDLLLDFPGEVLRNPAFRLAAAADPGLLRGASLARRAIVALDSEYRAIGLNGASEQVRSFVEFCDQRNKSQFRFQPRASTEVFDCSPANFPDALPLRSALRCASALAPAMLNKDEDCKLTAFFRQASFEDGGDHYGDASIWSEREGTVALPSLAAEVLRDLFSFHQRFELKVKGHGLDSSATLWGYAWSATLDMVRSQSRSSPLEQCFVVDGESDDGGRRIMPADSAAFRDCIRSLERVLPRESTDRIVLVIDDTHGMVLNFGVNVFSRNAAQLLGSHRIQGLRDALRRSALEDLCAEFELDPDEARGNEDEGDEDEDADVDGSGCALSEETLSLLSDALDRLHDRADPVFKTELYHDEFNFRIAAFRAGKLVAFRAEGMEMQSVSAKGSLRRKE